MRFGCRKVVLVSLNAENSEKVTDSGAVYSLSRDFDSEGTFHRDGSQRVRVL